MFSHDGNIIKIVGLTRALNSFAYYSFNVTCVLVSLQPQPAMQTRFLFHDMTLDEIAMFIAGERKQGVLLRRTLTEFELLHSP